MRNTRSLGLVTNDIIHEEEREVQLVSGSTAVSNVQRFSHANLRFASQPRGLKVCYMQRA